jgi:hypothetical protein
VPADISVVLKTVKHLIGAAGGRQALGGYDMGCNVNAVLDGKLEVEKGDVLRI